MEAFSRVVEDRILNGYNNSKEIQEEGANVPFRPRHTCTKNMPERPVCMRLSINNRLCVDSHKNCQPHKPRNCPEKKYPSLLGNVSLDKRQSKLASWIEYAWLR